MDNIFECDAPRSKGRKQGLINTRLIIYTQLYTLLYQRVCIIKVLSFQ